ncbi:porin [Gaetbulibacter saemankumensis]|uniref:porin n=1 Tax=Gaetbulibacter saemankumensis TaxID=311208 RepID=UPI000409DD64|nr:porin [Gaetbulibacter saemankumensis]
MQLNLKFLAILLLATSTFCAQEVISPKFGKGILNLTGKDSTWTMKMGLRFQTLGIGVWEDGASPETNFLIRRSRLKLDGWILSPKLKYKFELGLANRDIAGGSEYTRNTSRHIMDAVLKWNFYENFVLWVGQTKLPGNRERVISSADLQMVDRSILNSEFNIDRDIGIQLRHTTKLYKNFIMNEIFSLSQGEGRNVTSGNLGGFQYTGRVELLPFGKFNGKGDYKGAGLTREKKPKLSVAASYDFNNNAVRTRSNLGNYMKIDDGAGLFETNITTIFADAMFKYKGYSLMAEYAKRDSDNPIALNSDGTPTGDVVNVGSAYNIMTGYLFPSNWELTGRYTNSELNINITGKNPKKQYSLGLSKYIVGHKLKVQTDISYLDIQEKNNQLMYRLQVDVHF